VLEAAANPGARGGISHGRNSSLNYFDGGKHAGSRTGTGDGGEFARLCRLMAGPSGAQGIGPNQHPGSPPR